MLIAHHEENVASYRKIALPDDTRSPKRAMWRSGEILADVNSRQVYEDEHRVDWKYPNHVLTHLEQVEVAENVSIALDLPENMLPDFEMVYGSLKNYVTVDVTLDYKPYRRKVRTESCPPFDEWVAHKWNEKTPAWQRHTIHLSIDLPLNLTTHMKHYLDPEAPAPFLTTASGLTPRPHGDFNSVRLETTSLSVDDMYRPSSRQEWRDNWLPTLGHLSNRHLELVGLAWEKRINAEDQMFQDYKDYASTGEDFDEEDFVLQT